MATGLFWQVVAPNVGCRVVTAVPDGSYGAVLAGLRPLLVVTGLYWVLAVPNSGYGAVLVGSSP